MIVSSLLTLIHLIICIHTWFTLRELQKFCSVEPNKLNRESLRSRPSIFKIFTQDKETADDKQLLGAKFQYFCSCGQLIILLVRVRVCCVQLCALYVAERISLQSYIDVVLCMCFDVCRF